MWMHEGVGTKQTTHGGDTPGLRINGVDREPSRGSSKRLRISGVEKWLAAEQYAHVGISDVNKQPSRGSSKRLRISGVEK